MEPSQDETKAQRLERGDAETKIEDSLPTLEGEQNLFAESLTLRELSLLQALNGLDSAEILNQLQAIGVSNKEVARRLGHGDSTRISKIANRKRQPGENLRAEIVEIALAQMLENSPNKG